MDISRGDSKKCYFYGHSATCNNGTYIGDTRKATPEEKHWLNVCIEAGNFVSKEEALKNFNIEIGIDYDIY